MKQQYKILSRSSSHKGEVGDYVGGFQYGEETFYTLKLKNEGFRSYPIRNLELQELKDTTKETLNKFFEDIVELTRLLERRNRIYQVIKSLEEL